MARIYGDMATNYMARHPEMGLSKGQDGGINVHEMVRIDRDGSHHATNPCIRCVPWSPELEAKEVSAGVITPQDAAATGRVTYLDMLGDGADVYYEYTGHWKRGRFVSLHGITSRG